MEGKKEAVRGMVAGWEERGKGRGRRIGWREREVVGEGKEWTGEMGTGG